MTHYRIIYIYVYIYIYTHTTLRNLPSLLETALFPVAPFEGGGCDGILLEGDLVLSVNGKPVTKPHVTWIEKMENMQKNHRKLEEFSFSW